MKRLYLLALPVSLILFVAGCLPGSQPPEPGAATPKKAEKPAWERDWETTLVTARSEGKLVALSTLGANANDAVAKAFKEKFGLNMEFVAGASGEVFARVQKERGAGIYTPDIYMSGGASIILLREAGYMDSVKPLIVLPEAKDPRVWFDGDLSFVDKEGFMLVYQTRAIAPFLVNADMVKPDEIKSYKDLLAPKWKGNIVVYDPTIGSVGAAFFQVVWEVMGPQYAAEFGKQDLVATRDGRQQVEWLARGKYPVSGTPFSTIQAQFVKEGAPIKVVLPAEGTMTSASQGVVGLVNRAPHPNAAKVFINWLLTKEAQTLMSQLTGDPSRRLDVSQDHVDPAVRVPAGSKFASSDTEEMIKKRQELQKLSRETWNIK